MSRTFAPYPTFVSPSTIVNPVTPPFQEVVRMNTMESNMLDAISIVVQVFSVVIIGRYDPSHSSKPILCPSWPTKGLWTVSWQSCQQLENYPGFLLSFAFDDPSPAAFVGALAIFTLATLYLYSFHQEARYQKHCLVAAVIVTAIISITRHFMFPNEPLVHSIQISLPIGTMGASILNAIIHRMGSSVTSRAREREREQQGKTLREGQEQGQKQGS